MDKLLTYNYQEWKKIKGALNFKTCTVPGIFGYAACMFDVIAFDQVHDLGNCVETE